MSRHFELLRPQEIIVDHLRRVDNALVFAGMGISKTAACLYRVNEMLLEADITAALVVAPMRVINITWPSEVKEWLPFRWMKVANLRTEEGQRAFIRGKAHLYLINYESLHHLISLIECRGGKLPYEVSIFDESTRVKNPSSKRVNAFRRAVPRTKHNWLLTGTPVPNSNLDLFAQVRLCDGGQRLGTNYHKFRQEFFMQPAYAFAPWKEKSGTKEAIEQKISDITITLKSSEWLDIPDTIFEDVEIHFTPELQKKYTTLERDLVIELRKDKIINIPSSAALITKLLQFTSGCMYDDERAEHPIHELKFEALKRIINSEPNPVFVSCQFKHEYVRMKQYFPESVFFNDAKTPQAQEQLVRDWSDGKIRILYAHPGSCGHGLNLQYGSHVLIYPSLTYNREHYEQMICRFARRGQTEITKVYRLMISNSVDDAVAEALANKADNEARLIAALQMLESYRNGAKQ